MEVDRPQVAPPEGPSLGICIPTYNRRNLLAECLQSVIPQCREHGVPIFVSDNGSTDGTLDYLQTLRRTDYEKIEIRRSESNLGFGSNLRSCISMATTDYLWLLSDDDVLMPGAIASVLGRLSSRPGMLVVNSWRCSEGVSIARKQFYRWHADIKLESGRQDALLVALSTGPAGSIAFLSQYIVDRRLLDLTVPLRSRDFEQIPLIFAGVVGRDTILVATPQVRARSQSEVDSPERVERPFRGVEIWFKNWPEAISLLDTRYSAEARRTAARLPFLQTIRVVVDSRSRGPPTRAFWEFAIRAQGIDRFKRAALIVAATAPRGMFKLLVPFGRRMA